MSQRKQEEIEAVGDLLDSIPYDTSLKILNKLTYSDLVVLECAIQEAIQEAIRKTIKEIS